MIITNEKNLPEALVQAVSTDRHNKEGCYSATTLLKGACETILSKRHFDEIKVDASDLIWAVFGSSVHAIFENQKDETFKEEFFSVDVSKSKVTGRVDSYDMANETLNDWKTCASWKIIYNDFDDWRKQGLIYAWLMKQNGLKVKKCRFIALLKDHSKSKARFDASYPQSPVYVYEFEVTEKDLEEIEKFIREKVKQFEEAEKLDDEKLPLCTADERWSTKDTWAIMKKGRKTALKLCASEEEAKEMLTIKGGDSIEFRQGENKKCLDGYCSCRDFCSFYKSLKK